MNSSSQYWEILEEVTSRADNRLLSELGEKQLLGEFLLPMCREICSDRGLGDDAGTLDVPLGRAVVVTTDRVPSDLLALSFGLMTPAEYGAYLVRVNMSDIAAMGASPLGLVVTASFPSATAVSYVLELMWGIYTESMLLGCPTVGGDTKASGEQSLSATALGLVGNGQSVGRGPIRPGMGVYCSGEVGHAGIALRWFARGADRRLLAPSEVVAQLDEKLCELLIRPRPRLDCAPALSRSRCPAAIDITDGLGQALLELALGSSVGIELDVDALRVNPSARRAAEILNIDMTAVVMGIGLDAELVAINESNPAPEQFYRIGTVVPEPANTLSRPGGSKLVVRGYEHFKTEPSSYLD